MHQKFKINLVRLAVFGIAVIHPIWAVLLKEKLMPAAHDSVLIRSPFILLGIILLSLTYFKKGQEIAYKLLVPTAFLLWVHYLWLLEANNYAQIYLYGVANVAGLTILFLMHPLINFLYLATVTSSVLCLAYIRQSDPAYLLVPNLFSTLLAEHLIMRLLVKTLQELEISKNSLRIEKTTALLLTDFAKQAAHDIKSPVQALQMIITKLGPSIDENIKKVLEISNKRILTISTDFLRFSKGIGISAESEIQSISSKTLNDLFINIIEEKLLLAPKLTYNLEIQKNMYIKIRYNEKSLERIVSNLINNSIDAITTNPNIDININSTNTQLVITLSDNGPGFNDKALANLGNAENSYGKKDGIGLGLYQAIKIIEAWAGELIVENQAEGAKVLILLPII